MGTIVALLSLLFIALFVWAWRSPMKANFWLRDDVKEQMGVRAVRMQALLVYGIPAVILVAVSIAMPDPCPGKEGDICYIGEHQMAVVATSLDTWNQLSEAAREEDFHLISLMIQAGVVLNIEDRTQVRIIDQCPVALCEAVQVRILTGPHTNTTGIVQRNQLE